MIKAEALSAVRRLTLHGHLADRDALRAVNRIGRLAVSTHSIEPLVRRIWELRDTLTVYDAWYVALAERLDTTLITADRKLAQAPGIRCDVELVA